MPDQARLMRLEKEIPAKIVIDPFEEDIFHNKKYRKITEIKYLKSLKDFPAMIFIYGNKVAMYTIEGDLIGVIIENKEFSEAMKIIFEMYWKVGKSAKF